MFFYLPKGGAPPLVVGFLLQVLGRSTVNQRFTILTTSDNPTTTSKSNFIFIGKKTCPTTFRLMVSFTGITLYPTPIKSGHSSVPQLQPRATLKGNMASFNVQEG